MSVKPLTAVVSGRQIELDSLELPAVLIFHGRKSAAAAPALQRAIRAEHPDAAELIVASVVDLSRVPRLFRRFAGPAMEEGYARAAAGLPRGVRAEDYVLILPDWDGAAARFFRVVRAAGEAVAAVVAPGGRVVGKSPAADLERIFELIAEVRARGS